VLPLGLSTQGFAFFPLTAVYNPKAFILHAASLRQTFVHCGRFSTAASRRSLGSVSVPDVAGHALTPATRRRLGGRYPTNKLIGHVVSQRSYPVNPDGNLILRRSFPLRCFQRLSLRRSYPAMPWRTTGTPAVVHPGPLVLGAAPLKFPTPTADRDRPVSRRSEPSSRTALMGEQPNPWDLLQPQDATSRHRGAEPSVDVNSWARLACYPRGSFYPVSHGPSTRTVGSLSPTFVSARLVCLAVKLPYAFTLFGWFPFSLREPLGASVTLWEATAPVKLPTRHCPPGFTGEG
jgi:hypothetical protein